MRKQQTLTIALSWLMVAGLCAIMATATSLMGCEPEAKDNCKTNLDCGDLESCVQVGDIKDCKARGDIGASCKGTDPPCLDRNSAGEEIVCDPSDFTCKQKCSTNLDCANSNTQQCNTTTGVCVPKETPDEPPADRAGPPGKKVGEDCGTGVKCDSGLDCVTLGDQTDGKCWATCSADGDCKDSRICASGHCVPAGETCKGTPGGTLTTPCWAGLDCVFEGAGEGRCFRACTKDDECTNGQKCVETAGKKYCQAGGDVAGPGQECGDVGGKQVGCESGYQCVAERVGGTKKICTKECSSDADCNYPRFCNQICTLGTVGTAKLGAACEATAGATEDKRCDGGLACLVPQGGSGQCYTSCKDPRAPACADGTTCAELGQEKYCLKTCNDDNDCTAPSKCAQFQGASAKYCIH